MREYTRRGVPDSCIRAAFVVGWGSIRQAGSRGCSGQARASIRADTYKMDRIFWHSWPHPWSASTHIAANMIPAAHPGPVAPAGRCNLVPRYARAPPLTRSTAANKNAPVPA